MANLLADVHHRLPMGLWSLLRDIGEAASARGECVCLVGGAVRDLLLGRAILDLDLLVEGTAISLARELARTRGWTARTHPRFGTATLRSGDFTLDLATARSETYAEPGALPAVRPGTIDEDLHRRDFTINAMAVSLHPESLGMLFDPCHGRQDLDDGLIRILHPGSFSDDPTRIMRALRYEQRLGLHLEATTEGLLRQHAGMLSVLSGERLWHELELILREECPEKVLSRADELGVSVRIHRSLLGDGWLADRFAEARRTSEARSSLPTVYLAILACRLTPGDAESLIARLKLAGHNARTIRRTLQLRQDVAALQVPDIRSSQIYRTLEHYVPEVIAAVAVSTESPVIRQRLELHLNTLRHVRPSLSSSDLCRLGVPPGRQMGRILRALLEAKLDLDVDDEEVFVRQQLATDEV